MKEITINTAVTRKIAEDLLGLSTGDRLPTIIGMVDRYQASRGTVQNALARLSEIGAIALDVRGHMGTYLVKADERQLLLQAGIHSIYFGMPLPHQSLRFEGFATGLQEATRKFSVPGGIQFMSGSSRRLNSLLEKRLDIAVMSEMAASGFIGKGFPVEILHAFPPHSFIGNQCLITRIGFDLDAAEEIRVGVDETSTDQQYWISRFFPAEKIRRIPMQYAHIVDRIRDGTLDACIATVDENGIDERVQIRELHVDDSESNTTATLVVREGDTGLMNYLKRKLSYQQIYDTQQAVLNGDILPDY